MRVNGRAAAKPRLCKKRPHVRLGIGKIDENGILDAIEGVRKKPASDRIVLRHQRTDMRCDPAIAPQTKADNAVCLDCDKIGRGQTSAQRTKHGIALRPECRGVERAQPRPIRVRDRTHADTGRQNPIDGPRLLPLAAQTVKPPAIDKSQCAIDGAAIRRGVENWHEARG